MSDRVGAASRMQSFFFSFDTGPYRRVKASRRIELGGETGGGPSRQPLILFIVRSWTDDKTEPG